VKRTLDMDARIEALQKARIDSWGEISRLRLLSLSIEFPPGPGGLGTLTYQIAAYLAKAGWQVAVSTPQDHVSSHQIDSFNASQPFEILSLRHVEPSALEGIYRLGKAMNSVRRNRPSVVLAVGMQAVWLGATISRLAGVPLVAIGGGTEFLRKSRTERAITRWAFGRAKSLIAISNYTLGLMSAMGIDVSRASIIPPGADGDLYTPGLPTDRLRNRLELGDSRVILTVGHVSKRKAQDVVIRALPSVLKDCPKARYLIAGLPSGRKELEQLAVDLGVDDHVVFLGQVPQEELPYLYNLADVFVLVSRHSSGEVEGFGIAAVEAALCGTPAIVSRNCGLEEAVVENETAFVVDPDDPEATAKAITQLLTDDDLRLRMGQADLHYSVENATWDRRLRSYDILLRNLVSGSD
jgi:phosphatidylinositol alpha-1,6-mannosyltransferase